MIASGLCMMGGCFALENGATADSYWPAAEAVFSPELAAVSTQIISSVVPGGDSAADEIAFKGRFYIGYNINPDVNDYKIATGINRLISGPTPGKLCVMTAGFAGLLRCDYGPNNYTVSSGADTPEDGVEIEGRAVSNTGSFYVAGKEWLTAQGTAYSYTEADQRQVLLRSHTTRRLSWFWYRNSRTGVHFWYQALRSPGGESALYSVVDKTLTEI